MKRTTKGFSFIELLLVVAIIGIISAIAIPALLGHKKSAELVGDAQQNTKSLQTDAGDPQGRQWHLWTAGPTVWNPDGTVTGTNIAPLFAPKGSSKMDYTLAIGATGLTYTVTINDPRPGASYAKLYQTDETGRQIYPIP